MDKKRYLTSGLSNPCVAPSAVQPQWQHARRSQLHPLVKMLTTKTSAEFYSSKVHKSTQDHAPEAIQGRCLRLPPAPAPHASAAARANAASPPRSASVNTTYSSTAQFMVAFGKIKRLKSTEKSRTYVYTQTYKVRIAVSSLFLQNSSHAAGHKRAPSRSRTAAAAHGRAQKHTLVLSLSSLAQALRHVNCFSSELMCPAIFCRAWKM